MPILGKMWLFPTPILKPAMTIGMVKPSVLESHDLNSRVRKEFLFLISLFLYGSFLDAENRCNSMNFLDNLKYTKSLNPKSKMSSPM